MTEKHSRHTWFHPVCEPATRRGGCDLPAATTRSCQRPSTSGRPLRPAWLPSAWRFQTSGSCGRGVARRSKSTPARPPASLRSSQYMAMDGASVARERPLSKWVCIRPKTAAGAISTAISPTTETLQCASWGVEEDREAFRRAVAQWDALELEEAIIAANGPGGMVRSMAEWAQHPQAAAVASLPLLEIEKDRR